MVQILYYHFLSMFVIPQVKLELFYHKSHWKLYTQKKGLLKKSKTGERYAFVLPIPDNRTNIASKEFGNTSMLEIELLFNDNIIKNYGRATTKKITGGTKVWNITSNTKNNIIENLDNINNQEFAEFRKIFDLIENIQSGVYR